jgi:RNA polymerase sigma-70 factor (ECF subfamily)
MTPADPASLAAPDWTRWFTEHVQPHEPALRAYLSRRFPALPDHDDLVQETYARILRVRDPRRLAFAKAFLFTTARNAAIDLFRRRRETDRARVGDDADAVPGLLDEAPGVVESLERQQRLEVLLEALGTLPERCRAVMMLRYLDGFSSREIGARLGIAPGTVKAHLLKGVHDCVKHFAVRGLIGAPSEGRASGLQTPLSGADSEPGVCKPDALRQARRPA